MKDFEGAIFLICSEYHLVHDEMRGGGTNWWYLKWERGKSKVENEIKEGVQIKLGGG